MLLEADRQQEDRIKYWAGITEEARKEFLGNPNEIFVTNDVRYVVETATPNVLLGYIEITEELFPTNPNGYTSTGVPEHIALGLGAMANDGYSGRSKIWQRLVPSFYPYYKITPGESLGLPLEYAHLDPSTSKEEILAKVLTAASIGDNGELRIRTLLKANSHNYFDLPSNENYSFNLGRLIIPGDNSRIRGNQLRSIVNQAGASDEVAIYPDNCKADTIYFPIDGHYRPIEHKGQAIDRDFLSAAGQKGNAFREQTNAMYRTHTSQEFARILTNHHGTRQSHMTGEYYYYGYHRPRRVFAQNTGNISRILAIPIEDVDIAYLNPQAYIANLTPQRISELSNIFFHANAKFIDLDSNWNIALECLATKPWVKTAGFIPGFVGYHLFPRPLPYNFRE